MMKKLNILFLVGILSFAGMVCAVEDTGDTGTQDAVVAAQVADPVKMLREVTTNVLHALEANKNVSNKNVYAVVDKYILPHVDFNEMSEWVAGRSAWSKATEAQRKEFMDAFRVLVVRTYASALESYSNEKVEFVAQKVDTSKDRIQISSVIVRPQRENIKLAYRLVKHDNQWYVYDVIIEGVSILQGFQAQFSQDIKQRGLEPVIQQIKEHNKKTDV